MRADLFLTSHGYVSGRSRAKQLIESGCVTVDGILLKKASLDVEEGEHDVLVQDSLSYVGRGGLKLEGALDAFGMDVSGRNCLDIGASTGGFTDCLLKRGANHVWAVDSGEGQLAAVLQTDDRVTSMEHCNARYLSSADFPVRMDLIVMDVSFISATLILPRFSALMTPESDAVVLIKPQFEVGKSMIGKGGIVKDKAAHRFAVEKVVSAGRACGLVPVGLIPSPVLGGDGNREFLVRFAVGNTVLSGSDADAIRRVVG